jgi:hypothetical protein
MKRKGRLAAIGNVVVIIKNGSVYYDNSKKHQKLYSEDKRSIQMGMFYKYKITPCGKF